GGVTLLGLLVGAIAATAIAMVARVMHIVAPPFAGVAAAAGFLATLIDSVLGATLERRGWLTNNAVNFLSTLASGAMAIAFIRLVFH
ncbi:MAG: DUF92 domain-containing protein, partial [Terriglobales bacterium]